MLGKTGNLPPSRQYTAITRLCQTICQRFALANLTFARGSSIIIEMDYSLDDLEWKCLDCKVTAPPTSSDYMKLIKHAPGQKHHVRLVDKKTGTVIASSPKGAAAKGIVVAGVKPKGIPSTKPKASQQQGGEMVAITQPKQGAIVFSVGVHEIPLEPQYLYESYLYYTDLKARIALEESFSEALKDAMTYVWRRLCPHEAKGKELAVKEG